MLHVVSSRNDAGAPHDRTIRLGIVCITLPESWSCCISCMVITLDSVAHPEAVALACLRIGYDNTQVRSPLWIEGSTGILLRRSSSSVNIVIIIIACVKRYCYWLHLGAS